jgi:prophage antirepressor-like protein
MNLPLPDPGIPRSNRAKRRDTLIMLQHDESRGWSDRRIARYLGVSNNLVSQLRRELHGEPARGNSNPGLGPQEDQMLNGHDRNLAPIETNGTEPQRFTFEDQDVRVLIREGEPWWVAKDVAGLLGYVNARKALQDHVDEEDRAGVTIRDASSNGTVQSREVAIINESGLYSLILRSNKPEGKRFKRWVTKDVLPTIRKTGGYGQPMTETELVLWSAQRLVNIERQQKEMETRLMEVEARQTDAATEHFSVVAYCNLMNLTAPTLPEAARIGKKAADLSRKLGITIGSVPDPRFGTVNTYHRDVLAEIIGSEP